MSERRIILHHHIFKNAGTSLDHTLERNLGARWMSLESSERGGRVPPAEVAEYVTSHPDLVAISSHTITPFRAKPSGWTPISIVFLRHPLDRARSIWEFNRRRPDDVPFGQTAKRVGLADYLELGLARSQGGDMSVADLQTRWLARDGVGSTRVDRALDTLGHISVVGLVEDYGDSIARLQQAAEPWFPGLRLRALRVNNRPVPLAHRILRCFGRDEDLGDRLRRLRMLIGDELYHRLEDANQDDLALWEEVRSTYRTAR